MDHHHRIHRYIDALAAEFDAAKLANQTISTLFIGGGTPSLLSLEQWQRLFDRLLSKCSFTEKYEWTVECNPESFTREKAAYFASIGVNRLSFGVQSMVDRELGCLGRPHRSEQVRALLNDVMLLPFQSIGVDLMYGIPGQSEQSFVSSLHQVLATPYVGHLSAYELTINPDTAFGRHRKLLPLPDDDIVLSMTRRVRDIAALYNLHQYEVSNYARAGLTSMHNRAYWNHDTYRGLGCAAHSYEHPRRFWNIGNVEQYCTLLEQGREPCETEEFLDSAMLAREMVFLGLRRSAGINEELFLEKTGFIFVAWASEEKLQRFVAEGLVEYQKPWWKPTGKGLLVADYLARELI